MDENKVLVGWVGGEMTKGKDRTEPESVAGGQISFGAVANGGRRSGFDFYAIVIVFVREQPK